LVDYQTVDLAQDFLTDCGWTTRGSPEGREGSAKKDTHIRHRHYLADAVYTIAVRLEPPEEDPGIGALERSVRSPERPLFLGRKCCLPSTPIFLARVEAGTLRQALENAPLACRSTATCGAPDLRSWWPAGEDRDVPGQVLPVTEDRDWLNQIHGGRRFIKEGWIRYPGVTHDR
jgi:CRISPR system Cascade subunit CasD